jgi:membrane-bound lytic murein transglycosylase B
VHAKGIVASTVSALMATNYASATTAADCVQRSFGFPLEQFLVKRGAATTVARGRAVKQSQGALFAGIPTADAPCCTATRRCCPGSRRGSGARDIPTF